MKGAGIRLGAFFVAVGWLRWAVVRARLLGSGDNGEEARRFNRAERGCGMKRTYPAVATGRWPAGVS